MRDIPPVSCVAVSIPTLEIWASARAMHLLYKGLVLLLFNVAQGSCYVDPKKVADFFTGSTIFCAPSRWWPCQVTLLPVNCKYLTGSTKTSNSKSATFWGTAWQLPALMLSKSQEISLYCSRVAFEQRYVFLFQDQPTNYNVNHASNGTWNNILLRVPSFWQQQTSPGKVIHSL